MELTEVVVKTSRPITVEVHADKTVFNGMAASMPLVAMPWSCYESASVVVDNNDNINMVSGKNGVQVYIPR
ncbi:MAG: hypothetical protein R2788_16595 [Saprospiraceae bacterium]